MAHTDDDGEQLQTPQRLLIIIKNRHTEYATEAWESPDLLIARAVHVLQRDTLPTLTADDCRLMAVDRWPTCTFVVCDLFHDQYDYDTAHLDTDKTNLPVTVLRSRGSSERPFRQDAYVPRGRIENLVNKSMRDAHESHGWRLRPPFMIDHKDGVYPVYHAPRASGRDGKVCVEADVTYERSPVKDE